MKYLKFIVTGAIVGVGYSLGYGEIFLIFIVSWLFLIPAFSIVLLAYGGIQEYKNISIRRNISLDDECIDKLKPYIEKNKGNFSATIRNIIKTATTGKSVGVDNIDNSIFKWMMNEIDGKLIPDSIIDEYELISIGHLEDYLNNKFNEMGWNVYTEIRYDKDPFPSNVLVNIGIIKDDKQHSGNACAEEKMKFVASLTSQILVKNSIKTENPENYLVIMSVINTDRNIKVELLKGDKGDRQDAIDSMIKFFGSMDETIKVIKNNLSLWRSIVNSHTLTDYNMVTIHKNDFEDLLAGILPVGEINIEMIAKKMISDIPLKELLILIKHIYETSRIFDRVEISGNDVILFHNYRNKDAIERMKNSLITLLGNGGHIYDAKIASSMIILVYRQSNDIRIGRIGMIDIGKGMEQKVTIEQKS